MKTPTGYKYQNFVYNIEYVPKRYLIKSSSVENYEYAL